MVPIVAHCDNGVSTDRQTLTNKPNMIVTTNVEDV